MTSQSSCAAVLALYSSVRPQSGTMVTHTCNMLPWDLVSLVRTIIPLQHLPTAQQASRRCPGADCGKLWSLHRSICPSERAIGGRQWDQRVWGPSRGHRCCGQFQVAELGRDGREQRRALRLGAELRRNL